MKLCPITNCKNPATTDPIYGILPCSFHRQQRLSNDLPSKQHEFTSEAIKEGRREYFKSAIQPTRRGEASKEFIEFYPEQAKQMFSEKEIKKAKNVWNDLPNWKNRHNTK